MANTPQNQHPNRKPEVVATNLAPQPKFGPPSISRKPTYAVKPTPDEKLDIAEALVATNGNFAMVGKRLNKSRGWVMNRIEYDLQLQELVEEVQQSIVDNVFSAMQIKAMAGDYACMNRILNTLGKHRGLHEKQEITIEHKDESPQTLEVQLNAAFNTLTPEQIRMLAGL